MRHSVKSLTLIALFAVIIAICSWVTIPFYVVPFTLQTLGIFLTLRFLGSKRGTVAIAVYLVLGALGVPVFAGFTGGIGRLLGPTGGYLVGFFRILGNDRFRFGLCVGDKPVGFGLCVGNDLFEYVFDSVIVHSLTFTLLRKE